MTNQPLLPESPCNARNTDQPVLPESRYVQRLTRETRNSLEGRSDGVLHSLRAVVDCAWEANARLSRAVVNRLESSQ